MINIPKGTKDVLPKESYKWQYLEKVAREVADIFNLNEIRTPIFEHTELFARGVGETTDVVNKEMYTFLDKGNRSMTLKPEGTAGVVRSFVENGLFSEALPQKLYYVTSCFRYERPQAGRLREFHQFGVEYLGTDSAYSDAEAVLLAKTFLNKLGLTEITLYVNSIGCPNCRLKYHTALIEYLKEKIDGLCELCKARLEKNPLRVLDCKNDNCKNILAGAPKITDYICEDCEKHFTEFKNHLNAMGVEFKVNPYIVRGLDYYTKTVFEFVSDKIGAQGTVCGGGRYDGLVSTIGGPKTPGIGFAMGVERLLIVMENSGVKIPSLNPVKIYVAPMGEAERVKAASIIKELRDNGIKCETDHLGRGIKSQFKYADKIGARFVGVIGSFELEKGVIKVKDMQSGTDEEVFFANLTDYLKKA